LRRSEWLGGIGHGDYRAKKYIGVAAKNVLVAEMAVCRVRIYPARPVERASDPRRSKPSLAALDEAGNPLGDERNPHA